MAAKQLELRVEGGVVWLVETEDILGGGDGCKWHETGRKIAAHEITWPDPSGKGGPVKGKAFKGAVFPPFLQRPDYAVKGGKAAMAKMRATIGAAAIEAAALAAASAAAPAKVAKVSYYDLLDKASAAAGVSSTEFLSVYGWTGSEFVKGAGDTRFRLMPSAGGGKSTWVLKTVDPAAEGSQDDAFVEKLRAESMADALAVPEWAGKVDSEDDDLNYDDEDGGEDFPIG